MYKPYIYATFALTLTMLIYPFRDRPSEKHPMVSQMEQQLMEDLQDFPTAPRASR